MQDHGTNYEYMHSTTSCHKTVDRVRYHHDVELLLQVSLTKVQQKNMNEDGKTSEKKFSDLEFQIFLTDHHTWGCVIFVL